MDPQEPQDALAAELQPAVRQPRADFPIALAVARARGQDSADRLATTSASLWRVFGPGVPRAAGAAMAYTLDRGTRCTAQIMVSG